MADHGGPPSTGCWGPTGSQSATVEIFRKWSLVFFLCQQGRWKDKGGRVWTQATVLWAFQWEWSVWTMFHNRDSAYFISLRKNVPPVPILWRVGKEVLWELWEEFELSYSVIQIKTRAWPWWCFNDNIMICTTVKGFSLMQCNLWAFHCIDPNLKQT